MYTELSQDNQYKLKKAMAIAIGLILQTTFICLFYNKSGDLWNQRTGFMPVMWCNELYKSPKLPEICCFCIDY